MKIVISSGHGKYVRGASGYIDEVDEARKVVEKVAEFWRGAGVGVDTFHDNTSTSQNQNLSTIVNYHNSRSRDLDVSVHFNAYQTTSKPMGTEVLYITQSALAAEVSGAIADAGDFIDRGAKYRSDLYFLNNTSKPAILIEVCFVDSQSDTSSYERNFDVICQAIAESIGNVEVGDLPPEEVVPPPEEGVARVDINIQATGSVIVSINGQEFSFSGGEDMPDEPRNWQNIIATIWKDEETAYGGPPMNDTEISVALPYKWSGERPRVKVTNPATGSWSIAEIRDVGPWMTDDNYWDKGTRPIAETCYYNSDPIPSGPNQGKMSNGAGIDLSPGLARAINIDGKGKVDWEFI